ncbi:hypothetical protein LCGC14_1041100 [marine sediment metagenome]|uniref:Uncharacterized protein n=1 Tax=marine sediment metagenome TaxID=412755 RepID=A0A0F9NDD0_9ZZZZ
MSSKISIAFTDLVMRGTKVIRPKSTFLGYADATLVISCGDVEVLQLRFRNMELKVLNGRFRFDFVSEKGTDDEWYPTCFPKSAISRKRLTAAIKRAYAARSTGVEIAA